MQIDASFLLGFHSSEFLITTPTARARPMAKSAGSEYGAVKNSVTKTFLCVPSQTKERRHLDSVLSRTEFSSLLALNRQGCKVSPLLIDCS